MGVKFTCQFTVPDAGDGYDYSFATRAVLETIAGRVGRNESGGVVRDVNGNKIGSWKLR